MPQRGRCRANRLTEQHECSTRAAAIAGRGRGRRRENLKGEQQRTRQPSIPMNYPRQINVNTNTAATSRRQWSRVGQARKALSAELTKRSCLHSRAEQSSPFRGSLDELTSMTISVSRVHERRETITRVDRQSRSRSVTAQCQKREEKFLAWRIEERHWLFSFLCQFRKRIGIARLDF